MMLGRDLAGNCIAGLGKHREWHLTVIGGYVMQKSKIARMHNRRTVSGDAGASWILGEME